MPQETQRAAGGVFIAIAVLVGAVAGGVSGQPSIGVLAGAAVGVVLAVWVWLRNRRRFGE